MDRWLQMVYYVRDVETYQFKQFGEPTRSHVVQNVETYESRSSENLQDLISHKAPHGTVDNKRSRCVSNCYRAKPMVTVLAS
jgi:hypothetical protein